MVVVLAMFGFGRGLDSDRANFLFLFSLLVNGVVVGLSICRTSHEDVDIGFSVVRKCISLSVSISTVWSFGG